jgi:hypothetical protein
VAGIRESAADLCIGFDSGCTCPACWARAACASVSLPEPVPPWPGGPVDRERWGSSADYRAGVED